MNRKDKEELLKSFLQTMGILMGSIFFLILIVLAIVLLLLKPVIGVIAFIVVIVGLVWFINYTYKISN